MNKIFILLTSILCLFYLCNNASKNEIIIPDEAIRFRVVANSNTIYDQNIKIQLKNVIQNKIFEILNGSDNIEDSRKKIKDNIDEIDVLVKDTLNKLNYDKEYDINYGYNYFPEKEYKKIKYKEGKYESLVIKLGDGKGDNWWCVLFPPLCLVESEESDVSDAQYSIFIKEIIDRFISRK